MARYAAATNTLAAEIAAIDTVAVAQGILASANVGSAWSFVRPFKANRQGIFAKADSMTWAAANLDTTVSTEPDEQAFTPTGRTYACTGHYADAVIGQYALADARSSGISLTDLIIREGARGYISYRDAQFCGLQGEASTATPDHVIGASTSALTKGLIDEAISLLLTADPEDGPLALVIDVTKQEELMAIPGMAEKSIIGGRGIGGIDGPNLAPGMKKIVGGYNGILDVYWSKEVTVSSGTHNLMVAVGDGVSNGCLANPWHPIETPNGQSGHMLVDVEWNSARRAIEVNMTTMEAFQGRAWTGSTDNEHMVDIVTAPAS